MRIAFNPSTVAALTTPPSNKDITFDLRGQNIFARGVKFYGTDTWRPVVDNLTSNSATSSLSANQGRVLAGLINGKSDSDHNHDGRYLKLTGGTLTGNLIGTSAMFSGRFYGNGDDEGIIIKPSSNGYAGLILGTHDGERSIFYFVKNKPFWRYSHGSDNLDIIHPKKSGTIALTSDIPSSVKNPYSLTTFGVVYDGSAEKVVSPSNFISQLEEGTSVVTDGTMLITSYASNSGFADTNAVNIPYKRKAVHLWEYIKAKTDSLYATKNHNHDGRYVRTFGTSNDNIDSDWGESFKTFDPIPSGTPPEQSANISLLSIGNNFNRRKQLAFIYNNDNIYYRRRVNNSFSNWRRLAFANEIPTSLKNPHALTISLNGTSQGPYDGSAAKNINITPGSIGAATSGHNHDDRYLRLAGGTMQLGEGLKFHADNNYFGTNSDARIISLLDDNDKVCDGGLIIDERGTLNGKEYVTELLRIRDSEFKWRGADILHSGNYSGILDSRYYTESEVNSLLSNKLNTSNFNWTNLPGKIVAGNEFNIVNAGFKESMWFNYLPINDRSKTATISSYHFGNGAKGYTHIIASGFIKNGSNSSYVLLGDGGHQTISSLSVNYANNAGNSDKVDGYHATSGNNTPWGTIPAITTSGWMDIGRQLEFHYDNTTGSDYSTVLRCTGNYSNIIDMPSKSGTLALTSQVLTWKSQIIDMRNYSGSYWHPVTVGLPYTGYNKIKVSVQLNSGDKPSWAEHPSGITCNMEIWATASGWGTTDSETICLNYTYAYCSQNPCGWMQLGEPSLGVLFLRGGSRYRVYTDFDATFTPHDQKYTWTSGSYSQNTGGPYTSCPGLNFNKNKIYANLDGYASSAIKLQTTHSLWGQSFDGTSDVSGSLSGTGTITPSSAGAFDIGTNSLDYRYGYFQWVGAKTNTNLRLAANNSDNQIVLHTNGNVGVGTNSPGYKLQINGDQYTTGWSRADNGFYCEGAGVHFTHNGSVGEIAMTSNNEFTWGTSTSELYFNFRKVSRGKTVTKYIWNAGSGTSWANHSLGALDLHGDVYWTNGDATMKIYGVDTCCGKENVAFQSTFDGQDPLTSTYVTEYRTRSAILLQPRGGNVGINVSHDPSYTLTVGGNIYSSGGFIKSGSNDNYVLLGGGGHKAESSLNVASATKVIVNQHTSNDINYPLVWSNQSNDSSVTENQLFKSWADLYYNPKNKILAVGGYFMGPWARFTDQNGALVIGDNISARISAIGDQIIFNTGSALRFGETAWDWNQWAGLKYNHSAKTIYLGIADNSVFNANSVQSNGTLKFPGISNIDLDNGAQIRREGSSQAWVNGRNGALLRETSVAGYHALWSLKTTNGSWDFGECNAGGGWNNVPILSYVTDSNYNSGNNTATYQIRFPLDSGTVALTKNIPSSLPANGGNADTLGGTSLGGLFTAFGNNAHNITATIGGVTKSFLVNYAADADKVDGVHITWAGALTSTNHLVAWEADGSALRDINPANVSVGNSDKVDGYHASQLAKAWSGSGTMNQVAQNNGNYFGMITGKGTEGFPNDDGGWTHVFQASYNNNSGGDGNTGNFWVTQIANQVGTTSPWIRSRRGGSDISTGWTDWVRIMTKNDVDNYYWADIKVSTSSNTQTTPTFNTAYATNWFRARGNSGFYFQDHAGGFYMEDNTWIKTWGSKALYVNNTIRSTNYQAMYGSTSVSAAKLESAAALIYGTDTSSQSINTYLRGTTVTLQVKKGTSTNYNALQLTDTYIYCNNYCDMKQGASVSGGNLTVSTKAYIAQKGLLFRANDQIWYQQPVCIACGYMYDGPSNPGMVGSSERIQKVLCNQAASVTLIDGNGKYRVIFTNIIANKFNREKMSLQLTGCPHGIDSRGVSDARGTVSSYGNALSIEVYTSDDNSLNPTSFYFALWTWE